MLTYKLHLIRHAITAYNLNGIYSGQLDCPLCPEGITDLKNKIEKYRYPNVQEVYCSPLTSCVQTADVLYPSSPLTVVEDLREMSLGDFEGKGLLELNKNREYLNWISNSLLNPPPNSLEGTEEFTRRITSALHNILKNMSERRINEAAVISHHGVIMGILTSFAYPRLPITDLSVPNCSGYTVSTTIQGWMRDGIVQIISPLPELK